MLSDWQKDAEEFDRLVSIQELDAALQFIVGSVAKNPKAEWLLFRQLKLEEELYSQDCVKEGWQRYVELFPGSTNGYRELSRIYCGEKKFEEAEALILKIQDGFAKDPWILFSYSDIAHLQEDWQQSAIRCRIAQDIHPEFHIAYEREIEALLLDNDIQQADKRARFAKEKFPENQRIATLWADIPSKRNNRYACAKRWIEVYSTIPDFSFALERAISLLWATDNYFNVCNLVLECKSFEKLSGNAQFYYIDSLRKSDFDFLCKLDLGQININPETIGGLFSLLFEVEKEDHVRIVSESLLKAFDRASEDLVSSICRHQGLISESRVDFLNHVVSEIDNKNTHKLVGIIQSLEAHIEKDCLSNAVRNNDGLIELVGNNETYPNICGLVAEFSSKVNRWIKDRTLRVYQLDLYVSGKINTENTFLERYRLIGSAIIGHTCVSYCFANNGDIVWATTSGHGFGCQISSIFFVEDGVLVFTAPIYTNEINNIVGILKGLESQREARGISTTKPFPRLLIGHNNYAHFYWNELSALLEINKTKPHESLEQTILYEPYGPLDLNFGINRDEIISNDTFYDCCFFHCSGVVISQASKSFLRNQIFSNANSFNIDKSRIIIWISLRLMYRHATNQLGFLERLIQALEKVENKYSVVLDGLSLPNDINVEGRYANKDSLIDNARSVSLLASEFIKKWDGGKLQNVEIVDATALNLCEASQLAYQCNFYICNSGTQQHKIGWISDISGIIHTNKYFCDKSPSGEWVQIQCQGEAEAFVMPGQYIIHVESGNERQHLKPFQDYAFTNLEMAKDWVIDTLNYAIEP